MSWRPLRYDPTEVVDDLKKKTRILVDESLGQTVAGYLRENGYNAVFVNDVGLFDFSLALAISWRRTLRAGLESSGESSMNSFLVHATFARARIPSPSASTVAS